MSGEHAGTSGLARKVRRTRQRGQDQGQDGTSETEGVFGIKKVELCEESQGALECSRTEDFFFKKKVAVDYVL